MRRQAIAPRYDSKPAWEIFMLIAGRMGAGQYFPYKGIEDIWNYQLEGTGVKIEDFSAKGSVGLTKEPILMDRNNLKFKTPSGKIEFISQELAKEGFESFKPYTSPKKPEKGAFRLTFGRRIWLQRTKGIGVISARDAIHCGLTGPTLRGSGVPYDVRKHEPYDAYDKVDFEVPVGKNGDVYDRYRCRMGELRQSNRIIRQCIERMPDGHILADNAPELDMPAEEHRKLIPDMSLSHACIFLSDECEGITPAGEFYSAAEVPKGELGFYILSDGSGRPYRMRLRSPSFVHASALPRLCRGHMVADVIALIGTIDIVLGECDR
jgi:NADH:ubiquinone oxidoreductase subunit D